MVDLVTLYRAPTTVADAEELAAWLDEWIEGTVEVRDRFLDAHTDTDTATAFAEARVLSPYERATGNTMLGIVRYEERVLADPNRGGGVLYAGHVLQDALRKRLPPDERALNHLHVILLDRTIATWGDHDGRWHKRVNVLGQPALISIPGLYEGPAKPEAYYREKQRHALLSGDTPPREVLEAQVEGDFLIADDPRTTDALKGYLLQAVHLIETGEAFCDDPTCRLFNAHRQPGVIQAQLRSPAFCERHAGVYG